jgi:predicted MarR family transcription regulator
MSVQQRHYHLQTVKVLCGLVMAIAHYVEFNDRNKRLFDVTFIQNQFSISGVR